MVSVSPLAPKGGFPDLPVIEGVSFATAEAGVRYSGRPDVMLARLSAGTSIAGVFTKSATRSANVLDCQAKLGLDSSAMAAIVVNSGNSNAFTGKGGVLAVQSVNAAVAKALGIAENRVFSSATGVIGEALPFERITAKIDELSNKLCPDLIKNAAHAIMTTRHLCQRRRRCV